MEAHFNALRRAVESTLRIGKSQARAYICTPSQPSITNDVAVAVLVLIVLIMAMTILLLIYRMPVAAPPRRNKLA